MNKITISTEGYKISVENEPTKSQEGVGAILAILFFSPIILWWIIEKVTDIMYGVNSKKDEKNKKKAEEELDKLSSEQKAALNKLIENLKQFCIKLKNFCIQYEKIIKKHFIPLSKKYPKFLDIDRLDMNWEDFNNDLIKDLKYSFVKKLGYVDIDMWWLPDVGYNQEYNDDEYETIWNKSFDDIHKAREACEKECKALISKTFKQNEIKEATFNYEGDDAFSGSVEITYQYE